MCLPHQMDADDMGDMPGMPGGGMPGGGMGGMGGLGGLLNDPELMASMTDPVRNAATFQSFSPHQASICRALLHVSSSI